MLLPCRMLAINPQRFITWRNARGVRKLIQIIEHTLIQGKAQRIAATVVAIIAETELWNLATAEAVVADLSQILMDLYQQETQK